MSLNAFSLTTISNDQGDIVYDVLCTDCRSIFDDAAVRVLQDRSRGNVEEPRRTHLTLGALMESVERSCHLCNLIFGCLQNSILYFQMNDKSSQLRERIDLKETQLFIKISPSHLIISGDHVCKSAILWGFLEITPIVCVLAVKSEGYANVSTRAPGRLII